MADQPNTQGDNPTPTPEELKQEEEALKESNEDEVRSQVIEKYGLDEVDNEDLIENLTKDTLEQRKAFGKVIQQKRTWREKAGEAKPPVEPTVPTEEPEAPETATALTSEQVSEQVTATLEKRDLDALEFSDELKEEVKDYAKLKGISVKKALDSKYIKHELAVEKGEEIADEASIGSGTRKPTTKVFSEPGIFDHSTEKGRKDFEKWEQEQKEALG